MAFNVEKFQNVRMEPVIVSEGYTASYPTEHTFNYEVTENDKNMGLQVQRESKPIKNACLEVLNHIQGTSERPVRKNVVETISINNLLKNIDYCKIFSLQGSSEILSSY